MRGRQVFKDHCCCHSDRLGGSPDTTVCIPSLLSGKRLFLPRAPELSPFSVVSGFFINLQTDNRNHSVYYLKHSEHVMILHLFFHINSDKKTVHAILLSKYYFIHPQFCHIYAEDEEQDFKFNFCFPFKFEIRYDML